MFITKNVYWDEERKLLESHHLALKLIKEQFNGQSPLSVLEVGIGSGMIAKALREIFDKVSIDAVDKFEVYLEKSKDYYDNLYRQAIEDFDNNRQYDLIILLDVLEHLENPWSVLSNLKDKNLSPSGSVVISIPNIAHWTIVKELLKGNFQYTDTGILDKTHLRFFTIESYQELIISSGLKIDSIDYTYKVDDYSKPLFSLIPERIKKRIIPQLSQLSHRYPRYLALQFVSLCKIDLPNGFIV